MITFKRKEGKGRCWLTRVNVIGRVYRGMFPKVGEVPGVSSLPCFFLVSGRVVGSGAPFFPLVLQIPHHLPGN